MVNRVVDKAVGGKVWRLQTGWWAFMRGEKRLERSEASPHRVARVRAAPTSSRFSSLPPTPPVKSIHPLPLTKARPVHWLIQEAYAHAQLLHAREQALLSHQRAALQAAQLEAQARLVLLEAEAADRAALALRMRDIASAQRMSAKLLDECERAQDAWRVALTEAEAVGRAELRRRRNALARRAEREAVALKAAASPPEKDARRPPKRLRSAPAQASRFRTPPGPRHFEARRSPVSPAPDSVQRVLYGAAVPWVRGGVGSVAPSPDPDLWDPVQNDDQSHGAAEDPGAPQELGPLGRLEWAETMGRRFALKVCHDLFCGRRSFAQTLAPLQPPSRTAPLPHNPRSCTTLLLHSHSPTKASRWQTPFLAQPCARTIPASAHPYPRTACERGVVVVIYVSACAHVRVIACVSSMHVLMPGPLIRIKGVRSWVSLQEGWGSMLWVSRRKFGDALL